MKISALLFAASLTLSATSTHALDRSTDIWLWVENSEFQCKSSLKFENWIDTIGKNQSETSRLRNQGYFYILNKSQTRVEGVMATSYDACKRYSSSAEVSRKNAQLSGSGGSSKRRYSCTMTCSNPSNSFGNQDTKVQIGITAPSLNSAYDYINHHYNGICRKRGLQSKFSGNAICR